MNATNETPWEVVAEVPGSLQAELLRGLLEANDIQVLLLQEGAGRAYGLTVGPLGMVKIMVPAHQAQEASTLLEDYQRGALDVPGGES